MRSMRNPGRQDGSSMSGWRPPLLVLLSVAGISCKWDVLRPPRVRSVSGSCALIPCSFAYPSDVSDADGVVKMWYKDYGSDQKLVYHSTDTADAAFLPRVELVGEPAPKNCTILIRNLQAADSGKFQFRFEIIKSNKWLDPSGTQLEVADNPLAPEVVVPPQINEGSSVTFQCSTPYFCPDGSVALEWTDYPSERSSLSFSVQMDMAAVLFTKNLTSSFSWKDHQKRIRCEVTIGEKKATKEITLSVAHSPKGVEMLVNPSGGNLKEGDSVTLSCQANSSHPPVSSYSWYKDGQQTSSQRSISFHSLSRNDHGEYRCEAENSLGRASSDTFRLVVFSARILVTPSQDLREGASVTLTCEVPGHGPEDLHYSWFKNNIWIKHSSAASLSFPRVSASDGGYYYCKVQNDKGSDSSAPAILSVQYPPRTPSLSSFLETQRGGVAIIHCSVDSHPASELAIYKDGRLLASSGSHATPSERVQVIPARNDLRLKIQDVTLADQGLYACAAQNALGNSTASLQLTVETARVLITPSAEVEEGKEVTLTCLATRGSEEGATYSWYKNSKLLKEDMKGKDLVLHRLMKMDAGSYFCKAHSSQGASISPPVTLRVLFPPRDLLLTSLISSQGTLQAVIRCTVESDPPSQMFLYRGRTLVASSTKVISNKRYEVSFSTNSLQLEVQNVVLEDEGQYACLANTSYGQMSGAMDFTAETATAMVSPAGEVREGSEVNLTCYLKTISDGGNSSYSWYKDEVLQEGGGRLLQIPQISSADSGFYHCRAWRNESSKSSAAVRLNVAYAPRSLQVMSFQDTADGSSAFIRCSADSFPSAEMTLYRDDQLVASSRSTDSVNERYKVTSSRNELMVNIRNLRLEDGGKYNCSCRNRMGAASQTVDFSVKTARLLVSPSTEVLEGSQVIMTCKFMKSEETENIWYKNSRWFKKTTDSSLVFDNVKDSDSGYYHCAVQGAEGRSVSPPVFLHVTYGPRTPVMSSFWEAQSGQMGTIQCSVDSDPPSRLALYFKEVMIWSSDAKGPSRGRMRGSSSQNTIKMEIRDVRLEDEGTYLCAANNSIGKSRATINFAAQTTRVVISPSSVVQEGQAVNLACEVHADAATEASYTWYKNGVLYSEGSVQTLQFTNVNGEDRGAFACSVRTSQGNKSSQAIILDVLYPPKNVNIKSFVDTEQRKVAVILGSVDSNPPSELSLYKDGQLIASSSGGRRSSDRRQVYFLPDLLRLEIANIKSTDQGRYLLTAKNALGTNQASVIFSVEEVRVLVSPSTEVREGHIATLTCDVLDNSEEIISYTWYKNSRWLQEVQSSSFGLGALSSGDAGSYSCAARTPTGSKRSAPVTLSVLYPPRNLTLTSFLELQGRQRAVILCTVESNPASQMHLLKGKETLDSTSLQVSTQRLKLSPSHNTLRLQIGDVTINDQGEYTCQAHNSLGTLERSMKFTAQSARLLLSPSEEIHEGQSVTLTCEVPPMDNVTYTWYKNNRWLHEGVEKTFVLDNISSSETGSYQCLASHWRGNRSSPLVGISVLYGPKNLVIWSFLETHERNRAIVLCSVDSHPPSTIGLYKNNVLLGSSALRQADGGRKYWTSTLANHLRLEIRDFTAKDCGSYVCIARNTLGAASSSVDLNLADGEAPAYKAVSWLAMVCILLLAASIVIILYRRRIAEKCQRSAEPEPIEMAGSQADLTGSTVALQSAEHSEQHQDCPGLQDGDGTTTSPV